jgi:hypothetical protein
MKQLSKTPPIKYKFKRQPTNTIGSRKVRWVKEQLLTSYTQQGDSVELTIRVPVTSFFDKSLAASTGRGLGTTDDLPARTYIPYRRIGDDKYWQFKTTKGVEIVSQDGVELDSVPVGSSVSIRYSPVVREHGVYLALEVIVVHEPN